ncbi:MAG: FAD-dependent oxidoreductase [Acidimicrobiales bacterium]
MSDQEIVIVGSGLAGLRAAERLRERGFDGYITMVGDEPGKPYNRPPLSKQVLMGKMRESELGFQTFTHLGVELRSGLRAVGLDAGEHRVDLDSGESLYYDGLVIASGVEAVRMPGAPEHDDRVMVLRTLADCQALDRHMRGAKRVAIIGGGFIGCEVAATARYRSLAVTLIDRAPVLLHRVLGRQLGGALTEVHRRAGVDVRSGVAVERWTTSRAGVHLELSDGSDVLADLVLVAIGTRPAVSWLEGTPGVDLADGVLCDETCHVVGLNHVVAAGDVARWPNLRFDRAPRRVEHWINAVEMARAAADSLLDGRAKTQPFTPVPRFWSEQHGIKIQSVGMPVLGERIALVEGDVAKQSFVAAYLRGPRLVGVIGFNSARSVLDCAPAVEAANTEPIPEAGAISPFRAASGSRHQGIAARERARLPRTGSSGPALPAPAASPHRSRLASYYGDSAAPHRWEPVARSV